IHNRMEKRIGNSIFSYAGSTEIKSTNEIDTFMRFGKSVNMVSIEGDETTVERIPIKSVRPQLIVRGNLDECMKGIDEFASKNAEALTRKRGILTTEINESISSSDVLYSLSSFQDRFFIRTPIIKAQDMEKHDVATMTESLRELFMEYFDGDEATGKLAYDIYRDVMDNEPDDAIKSIEQRFGIGGA
ncbi:MAG: hypothetical protein ACYC9S_14065, partial [Leptospirales bacterium]